MPNARYWRPALAAFAALVAAAAGCAPSGAAPAAGPPPAPQQQLTRVDTPNGSYEMRLSPDDRAVEAEFPASAERLWAVLPLVYDSLGITLTTINGQSRSLGANNARVRRRLGGQAISRSLGCGAGPTGENNADSYDVLVTVMSAVAPSASGRAVVRTWVQGSARPIGTSGDPVRCATTGWLERRIAQLVAMRLAP